MVIIENGKESYKCSDCGKRIFAKTEEMYGGMCIKCYRKHDKRSCSKCNANITKVSFIDNDGLCFKCNTLRKEEQAKIAKAGRSGKEKTGTHVTLDFYDEVLR